MAGISFGEGAGFKKNRQMGGMPPSPPPPTMGNLVR